MQILLQRPGRLLAGESGQWVSLVLASAMAVAGQWRAAIGAAVAIELTAAALETLDDIEDGDLPPTDPILALGLPRLINASTALLTFALATLRGQLGHRLRQSVLVAHAGQERDLASTGLPIGEAEVAAIAQAKTAQFAMTAAWLGATAAGATAELAGQIATIGHRLGLMGQWHNDLNALRPSHSASDFSERKPNILVAASGLAGPAVTVSAARHEAVVSGAASYVWLLAETERQEALVLLVSLERAGHPVAALRSLLGS